MNLNTMHQSLKLLILPLLLLASACSTLEHSPSVKLDAKASWVMLPIANLSDTPQAGLRLESILESQLRAAGVNTLKRYPAEVGADLLLDPRKSRAQEQAAAWAREQGARYAISGTVNEWRYKTGVDGEITSRYLVAAPLYREDTLFGLLTVEHMPFFAFQQDTLQTLTALLSYYTDSFSTGQTHAIAARFPDCPPEFAQHLGRLAKIQQAAGVPSHLAVLCFPASEQGQEIRRRLARSKRELDFYWLRDDPAPLLIALFPLTPEEGVQGYLARVDLWLETEYGKDHRSLGIRFRSAPLAPGDLAAQLQSSVDHAV